MICWYHCPGLFWFRVFGYGLRVKRVKLHPLLFSERGGQAPSVTLFGVNVRLLKKSDLRCVNVNGRLYPPGFMEKALREFQEKQAMVGMGGIAEGHYENGIFVVDKFNLRSIDLIGQHPSEPPGFLISERSAKGIRNLRDVPLGPDSNPNATME